MDVFFARALMAVSLGFHILFAMAGIAMPLLMTLAEWRWRKTGDEEYLALAKTWSKGTAVLFAVGAVSGTVLSFELGLLFPEFMRRAGPVVGWAFGVEGIAFFTEAIFLGLYLYGWNRLSARAHLFSGIVVSISGPVSAVIVTIANAWMNTPNGFKLEAGRFVELQPLAILGAPAAPHEVIHMVLAAYAGAGIAVAAIHAMALVRAPGSGLHRRALTVALAVAIPCTLLQPVVGHWAGQRVAKLQPMKLAAMEQLFETQKYAPLTVGPISVPGLLSFMAFNDPAAEVKGLREIPEADWPHPIVKPSFQLMVALGSMLALHALWAAWLLFKKRPLWQARRFLAATVAMGPLGFLAVEAGWIVTEMGRQPWTIYEVMRTSETVTPMRGLVVPFIVFTGVYLGLAAAVVSMLRAHVKATLPAAKGGQP